MSSTFIHHNKCDRALTLSQDAGLPNEPRIFSSNQAPQPRERPRRNTIDPKRSVKTDSENREDRRAFQESLAILITVATRKVCMKTRHWTIAGTALFLMSCQSNRPPQATVQPSPQAFAKPVVPQKLETVTPIKVPGMIPTTDNKTPLMPVAVDSTRDPFAAPTLPAQLQATVVPQKTIAAKSSVGSQPIVRLPQPVQYNPLPQTVSIRPLPAIPIAPPPMPPVSRTNLAESIALTGVIQTGNQVSAIIEDTDGTSRYVQVGEKLANGEVTVKRINLNTGGEPSIVLVQNGVEFVRTVGRSEGSIAQSF